LCGNRWCCTLVVFNAKEREMTTRVNVARWRGHIEAAEAQGVTLAAYARQHGLSPHTLYAARQQMQREGKAAAEAQHVPGKAAPFVAVRVAPEALPSLRVRLPNGVAVEFGSLAAGRYAAVLNVLAALPCSN
jgi:Transposase